MIKKILLFIILLEFISCSNKTTSIDYFGQAFPDSIPTVFAPNIISVKGRLEHGLSFSHDMTELVFGILDKNDFSGKIFYSKKTNENWAKPKIFVPLKSKCVYLPYFSPNGKFLLYAQSKPNGNNAYTDIWMLEKMKDGWNHPRMLQSPISSLNREANASMTYDGTVYFSSNRNCEEKENCYAADLFYSKLINDKYYSVEEVSALNSPDDEESVFISPNEEYIIFCRYTDPKTWADLYISYRDKNNNWITPQPVDSTINSKDWDRRPFVSIDNKYLFFTRLQMGEKGLTESDIFWVNTSKLFKPFVYNPFSDITVKVGKEFEIAIPKDYFKDIDDKELNLSINQSEFDWLEFDREKMKLSGLPTMEGNYELIFKVVDKSSNETKDKIRITVIE